MSLFLLPALFLPEVSRSADFSPVFEDVVAPLLKARCVKCHNNETQKGELDLSSSAGVVKGGESGPIFESGDPEHSHLFELVERGEMPKKGKRLDASELKILQEWISGGAHFRVAPTLTEKTLHQHDVLPILHLRCVACHGPQRKDGGLDLRTPESLAKGGDSGSAFLTGKPDESLMIQRIESEACPPQALLLKYFVKRPPASEVAILRDWISAGAPVVDIRPDIATNEPDPLVTEEDRKHWAFQAPKATSGLSSIDEFIERQLTEARLAFSEEAERDTLIRRAFLDLIGLPPDQEEWLYWRESDDPEWFSTMVDHLLDSPHYGERWGRYWLDLAGYADSEGGTSADPLREVAWKYRDYVIAAFNKDKPYDEFLVEQIAGDELIDVEKADEVTEEMVENLIATGFLRMGIDETGSRTMNFVENRVGVISDVIDVLGSSVMGLTMECVRCHTHKYDPIPHRDYYRLKAIFQGALDEHDWLSFKTRKLSCGTTAHHERIASVNPPFEKKLNQLEKEEKAKTVAWQWELLRAHYPEQSEEDRDATFVALKQADNQRSLKQRRLVENLQIVLVIPDQDQPESVQQLQKEIANLEDSIEEVKRQMVPPLTVRALWDRGDPSPTYIHQRGVVNSPGRLVGPGVPAVLTDGQTPFKVKPPFPEGTPKTGRRLAFANWLTAPDHPLTSRVMVNRIWYHHFGRGLVESLENFGVQSDPPSHPELLDWLALEFIESGWSVKEMHRLILNSRTWKQSSLVTDERKKIDPDNQLYSRMPLQRLDAEALRDSLLFVAGKLDPTAGGPPDNMTVDPEGGVYAKASPEGKWRRSIYLQYRRTETPTMLETFDYPEMGPNCVARSISTVSPQSLLLMNSERVRALAEALADRVTAELAEEKVGEVYRLALSRMPTAEEEALGLATLQELEGTSGASSKAALEAYCHAILNSAGFLYID